MESEAMPTDLIDSLNRRTMSVVVGEYSAIVDEALGDPERAALNRILPEVRGKRILDVGIGAGRTVRALNEVSRNYIGVDYVQAMVDHCRRNFPDVRFERVDARSMPQFAD